MICLLLFLVPVQAIGEEGSSSGIDSNISVQPDSESDSVDIDTGLPVGGDSQVVPYANIDPDYGVGTSYLDLFAGAVSKLSYGTHYVYYRENRYQYCLAYSSEMVLSGSVFTAPSATVVTYNTQSGSSYYEQPTWSSTTESNYRLDAGDYVVYSDLGMYPILYDTGVRDYAKTACVMLASFGIFALLLRLRRAICQRFL